MVVGDEIKRLAFILQGNRRPHHTEVIPDMKDATGLDAGKNAHAILLRKNEPDFSRCNFSLYPATTVVLRKSSDGCGFLRLISNYILDRVRQKRLIKKPHMKQLPAYHRALICLPIPLLALLATGFGLRENQIHKSAKPNQVLQFISGEHVLGFTSSGMYAGTGSHMLHVEFVSARSCHPVSDAPANDTRETPPLSKIEYSNLWDGVTLSYDAPAGAIARSNYRIEPHTDVRSIGLRYNLPVSVARDGSLRITFATGAMNESAPEAWQEHEGKRVPVRIAFAARGDREIGFTAGDYDRSEPLFIDPTLTWNTFLGSAQDDQALALATDATGDIYVAGLSNATWGAPVRPYTAGYDAFVARLNSSGTLIWNTFLGGTADEGAQGVAVDGTGNICVAGFSNGTWGTPVRGYSGNNDAFVAKIDPSGNLIWNTFLGSGADDAAQAVAADAAGNVYVGGYSSATWDSPVRAFSGIYDAFAAKLNASGVVSWNTFLGGAWHGHGPGYRGRYHRQRPGRWF